MSNVIQFPQRKSAPEPVEKSQAAQEKPTLAQVGFAHSLVGQALLFYANQGFDHGRRAQKALAAMNGALS
ncbi:hypothetical protein WS89_04030 [Burkholderia sp. MSMB1072]|uniref:hypothetical protein n=1 Tax=Burkholderia sp. MSMB1072 TaxID=1637871 RepID=UPI0007531DA4|nr:hypothetical protein [Burkholderia sp. MSMB1072]KVH64460.1 hypothetical protein WS89_04030 [Burkholderia sp. MSMB1072]